MRRLALIAALLLAVPVFASAAPRAPERGQTASTRPSARPAAIRPPARPQPAPGFGGMGTTVAAMRPVAATPAVPLAGYGVIFAARSPGAGYGMVVGETSRPTAHRIAEQSCARAGSGCRAIAEFSATCGAVAQGGLPARGRFPEVVTSISGGSAEDRAGAEADALAECRSRDPGASCRVVAAQCGNRSA